MMELWFFLEDIEWSAASIPSDNAAFFAFSIITSLGMEGDQEPLKKKGEPLSSM